MCKSISIHFILHGFDYFYIIPFWKRLAGATLLVFANKQDLPGSLSKDAIREVSLQLNRQNHLYLHEPD